VDEWGKFRKTEELYQDFGIFDGREVALLHYGVENSKHGTMIIKNPSEVKEYQRIYWRIWSLSRPLNEVLNEHPPDKGVES